MDKVIIDGVDVSECEHYRAEIETKMPYGEYEILKDKCHYSGIEVIQNCKGNKGCLYKQLQRAKAENFELKESLKVYERPNIKKVLTYYRTGELERLEQENERLKKLKFKSDGIELLQDANLNLHNANVKYRQCLQEIREYCKEQNLKADYTACEIIDKINSVIGAE